MEIFEASLNYIDQINQFYIEQDYHSDWSSTERAFVCVNDSKIIATVKVECINNVTILRGMYVSENYQKQGIGTKLLAFIEPVLNEKIAYCMPLEHASGFYEKIGFYEVCESLYPDFLKVRCKSYIDSGYKIKTMRRDIST